MYAIFDPKFLPACLSAAAWALRSAGDGETLKIGLVETLTFGHDAPLGDYRLAHLPRSFSASDFVNPKVEPGKVRWHKSLEEAQAASLKTKKPVMIFQMMGKLDDQFC